MKKSARQGKNCVHDKIVADASVALKWFLQDNEDHCDKAIALLMGFPLFQPQHFIAEVAAVLVQKNPLRPTRI
jgi:predicted nucleic acid-binding protein